jgi:hypothetical protein
VTEHFVAGRKKKSGRAGAFGSFSRLPRMAACVAAMMLSQSPGAGFAASGGVSQISPFGLVHADACGASDAPGVGFVKTWWDRQGGPLSLRSAVDAEKACGVMETPVIVSNWDHAAPAAIKAAMTDFFARNRNVPVWEFGLEENLGHGDGCCSPSQLALLERKLSAVKEARADAHAPHALIAYQIANLGLAPYKALLQSKAAASIDVLAPHPYAWPDFATPETWHDKWIAEIKNLIRSSPFANKKMKIMYTEVGAPVAGVDAPGDRPQSLIENAQYLVKLHVLAYNAGVERVYWYQDNDNCADTRNAECNFGLIASNGARRPAYLAYKTLISCLKDKSIRPIFRALPSGVRTYEFQGKTGSCIVAWTYVDGVTERIAPKKPRLSLPVAALTSKRVASVLDVTGSPLPAANELSLSPSPIFIETIDSPIPRRKRAPTRK